MFYYATNMMYTTDTATAVNSLVLYLPPPFPSFHPHLIIPPPLGGHLVPYQTWPLPPSPAPLPSASPSAHPFCSSSYTQ